MTLLAWHQEDDSARENSQLEDNNPQRFFYADLQGEFWLTFCGHVVCGLYNMGVCGCNPCHLIRSYEGMNSIQWAPALYEKLVFYGTFSTNRLYYAIEVGNISHTAGGQHK